MHREWFSHHYINVWNRWDTVWYLKIAAFGYDSADGTVSYLPLYPWLIGGLGRFIGDFLLSALLVSNLSALVALILFFEVARTEGLTVQQAGFVVLPGSVSIRFFPFCRLRQTRFFWPWPLERGWQPVTDIGSWPYYWAD